jgi:hypothetical protein
VNWLIVFLRLFPSNAKEILEQLDSFVVFESVTEAVKLLAEFE